MAFRTLRHRKLKSPAHVLTAGTWGARIHHQPVWLREPALLPLPVLRGVLHMRAHDSLATPHVRSCFFAHKTKMGEGSWVGRYPPPGCASSSICSMEPWCAGKATPGSLAASTSVHGTRNNPGIPLLKSCSYDEFSHLSQETANAGF